MGLPATMPWLPQRLAAQLCPTTQRRSIDHPRHSDDNVHYQGAEALIDRLVHSQKRF
jgi:hypothetical protein